MTKKTILDDIREFFSEKRWINAEHTVKAEKDQSQIPKQCREFLIEKYVATFPDIKIAEKSKIRL